MFDHPWVRNFREQHHEDFSDEDNEESEGKPDAPPSSDDDYESEQYGDEFDSEEDGNLNYVEGSQTTTPMDGSAEPRMTKKVTGIDLNE